MIDGEESRVLAAVDGGGVAWSRLKLKVEHGEAVLSVGGGVWVRCVVYYLFPFVLFFCSVPAKKKKPRRAISFKPDQKRCSPFPRLCSGSPWTDASALV